MDLSVFCFFFFLCVWLHFGFVLKPVTLLRVQSPFQLCWLTNTHPSLFWSLSHFNLMAAVPHKTCSSSIEWLTDILSFPVSCHFDSSSPTSDSESSHHWQYWLNDRHPFALWTLSGLVWCQPNCFRLRVCSSQLCWMIKKWIECCTSLSSVVTLGSVPSWPAVLNDWQTLLNDWQSLFSFLLLLNDWQTLFSFLSLLNDRPCWMIDKPCWVIDRPCWMIDKPCLPFHCCWMINKPCWRIDKPCWMIGRPCWMIDKPCWRIDKPCFPFCHCWMIDKPRFPFCCCWMIGKPCFPFCHCWMIDRPCWVIDKPCSPFCRF